MQKFNHYIQHRRSRHQSVYDAVQTGMHTLEDIAKHAYADTPSAHPELAKDQTLSHLIAHQRAGLLTEDSSMWKITGAKP